MIKKYKIRSILSGGAGQDVFCFNLQKKFKNSLKVTILDISEEVLEWNKKLFERHNLNAEFVKADIFQMPLEEGSFDIIFNTGVLEHFEKGEQVGMIKEIFRFLKPSGYFVTANPSKEGKIYQLGMKAAKKKNIWPFGKEIPVESLSFLENEIAEIDSIKEYRKDFLSQLSFLLYINPSFKWIILPIIFSRRLPCLLPLYDYLFSKKFGTYLIISIIKKK